MTKTLRNFSSIPIDHAQEQINKLVKENSGTIGMTENTAVKALDDLGTRNSKDIQRVQKEHG